MPKIRKEEIIKAVERYKRGEMSQKAEAKKQGVSHQTFQDWIRRYETFGSDGFGNTGNRKFRMPTPDAPIMRQWISSLSTSARISC